MSVTRFDRGDLKKPIRLDNGYLRVDAYLTRSGVFTYKRADGTTLREYRPPEQVFSADAVGSFELAPVTNDHPPVGLLTPANTHQFQVGTVGQIQQDGDKLRGSIMLTDAKAIGDLEKGKREISLGYVCDLDFTPGVSPEGEHYDAVQTNIRGNHCALVKVGRAGPEIRVRLDSTDALMVVSPPEQMFPTEPKPMKKITLDGIEFEVAETVAQAFEKMDASKDAALSATKAEVQAAIARADAADAKVAELEKSLAEAPAKALASAKARAELESVAGKFLGKDAKFDGQDDDTVKKAVIAKLSPSCDLTGKSAEYVAARFDAEVEIASRGNPGLAAARVATAKADALPPTLQDRVAAFAAALNK